LPRPKLPSVQRLRRKPAPSRCTERADESVTIWGAENADGLSELPTIAIIGANRQAAAEHMSLVCARVRALWVLLEEPGHDIRIQLVVA
jgi:hypothetical protein